MKKVVINLILKNFQIFCISVLLLFFIGISLGLASHDAKRNLFFWIYICFAVLHVVLNIYFVHKLKGYALSYYFVTSAIIMLLYVVLLLPFVGNISK